MTQVIAPGVTLGLILTGVVHVLECSVHSLRDTHSAFGELEQKDEVPRTYYSEVHSRR